MESRPTSAERRNPPWSVAELLAEIERLNNENKLLRTLGTNLADAIKGQLYHGHPVSITVAYNYSRWRDNEAD